MEIKKISIDSLSFDDGNANSGTEKGSGLLSASIAENGYGRSICVDKKGVVIAGNKTLSAAIRSGAKNITVIETSGDDIIAVMRSDLDLSSGDDDRARRLAYFDNRCGELGLLWNLEQIKKDFESGINLDEIFNKDEIEYILKDLQNTEVKDMDFDVKNSDDIYRIVIYCPENLIDEVKLKVMKLRDDYPSLVIKKEG